VLSDCICVWAAARDVHVFMHLVVLGALWIVLYGIANAVLYVLMHLLVLGAFWRSSLASGSRKGISLNAPYGVGVSWPDNLIELETDGGES